MKVDGDDDEVDREIEKDIWARTGNWAKRLNMAEPPLPPKIPRDVYWGAEEEEERDEGEDVWTPLKRVTTLPQRRYTGSTSENCVEGPLLPAGHFAAVEDPFGVLGRQSTLGSQYTIGSQYTVGSQNTVPERLVGMKRQHSGYGSTQTTPESPYQIQDLFRGGSVVSLPRGILVENIENSCLM
jgi:hypothetical protein